MARLVGEQGESSASQSCVSCGTTACLGKGGAHPPFCPSVGIDEQLRQEVLAVYAEPENQKIMQVAAEVECDHYCEFTRLQETIEFAHLMGFKRIGIATCAALIKESRTLRRLLERAGFEVFGVSCKVGEQDKLDFGLPPEHAWTGPTLCNPVLQARLLAEANTELNVVMGLCVGHDILFNKYSEAPVTTLVVKDRVTGHNPCIALELADGLYKGRLEAQVAAWDEAI